jgi:hypothetical protein
MHMFHRLLRIGLPRSIWAMLVALTLSLALAAAPVWAGHYSAYGRVEVWRGAALVAAYEGTVVCPGEYCPFVLALPKRDYNRVLRWCHANALAVVVGEGFTSERINPACRGPHDWFIVTQAGLLSNAGNEVTHEGEGLTDVTVVIEFVS